MLISQAITCIKTAYGHFQHEYGLFIVPEAPALRK